MSRSICAQYGSSGRFVPPKQPEGNATVTPERRKEAPVPRDGLAIGSLGPGTALDVMTWNTCYRLTILDANGRAVITGGTRFQQPTEVRIEGSTAGGADFQIGWIGVGLRLEMSIGYRTITTSPVCSVEAVAA
jgi:hypothetical protein